MFDSYMIGHVPMIRVTLLIALYSFTIDKVEESGSTLAI